MELSKIMLTFVIFYISMTTVFCGTKFRVSKFNMCPPDDSKFLSLINLSLGQCVGECVKRKHCYAVGFKRTYNLCELYMMYTATSASRGKCVILVVDKDDNHGQIVAANETNVCNEWEVSQSSGINDTCSKQECQLQETLEYVRRFGNMNKVGDKKIDYCKQSGIVGKQVQTIKCSTDGKWEITDGKWETGSTLDTVCSSVMEQMTRLYCSQSHIQIFTQLLSQPDASEACTSLGGKLAKVDQEWKFDAIERILLDCPSLASGQYWVDGYTTRNYIDPWTFSDGTLVPMTDHFWTHLAPNDSGNSPKCFRMVRNSYQIGGYRFDDIGCSKPLAYICEQN